MNAIIDTSSLLALVKYYLPFSKSGKLYDLLKDKFLNGEILIIDKVADEAKYIAKGTILTELDFLTDKSNHIKTIDLLPNRSFFNMLENQFCNQSIKKLKRITETEFDLEKDRFLNTADCKILLFGLSLKDNSPLIVTEETITDNDSKLFKKIPENCKLAGLECCNIPTLLKDHFKLDLSIYLK